MSFENKVINEGGERRRLCLVATVPFAFNVFMRPHIEILKNEFDVTLVSNGSANEIIDLIDGNVKFVTIPIERKISLIKDCYALIKLWALFRNKEFDVVCSLLPKSGLLAMLAARFVGVPIRLNIFNGEVWANNNGLMRQLLKFTDRIIVRCATNLLAVSPSQRDFLISNRIVGASKIDVVANGSISGVDASRFSPNDSARQRLRISHAIPSDSVVFLYLGRLNPDKGVIDLFEAFSLVAQKNNSHHLMIVGPDEAGLESECMKLAQSFPGRVHRVGFTENPEFYMASADVICLPSYREGLPMVLIEAASVGLPAIASRIYGITDAVEECVTGILHASGDIQEIMNAMLVLGSDELMRKNMSRAALHRVKDKFSQTDVKRSYAAYYEQAFAHPKRL
jgi:glycosyltransferase involved in cell wall biosynthesis